MQVTGAVLVTLLGLGAASGAQSIQRAQPPIQRWLIAPDNQPGEIGPSSSLADLEKRFGKSNVTQGRVYVGEGDYVDGTIIYPDDPNRRVDVLWKDQSRRAPHSIRVGGDKSQWGISPGITLGTSLKEIERLNGGPFTLTGFEWDYSGTIVDWNRGRFTSLRSGPSRAFIRLLPERTTLAANQRDYNALLGDGDFNSGREEMQRLNPRVYQIIVSFESATLGSNLSTAGAHAVPLGQQERTLTIPVSGPAASVRCEYFVDLRGDQPNSGFFDWGRVATRPGTVVIGTASRGAPTTRLNLAFVYCPGFAVSVLRDQAIPGPVVQLAPLKPPALPTVTLKGRVPIASLGNLAGSTVEVRHYAGWITESYGAWDRSIPQFRISTAPMRDDGTFSVDLPDLARDPWVSQCRSHGWFRLTAKIRGTDYGLQPPAELNAKNWLDDQGLVLPPGSADLNITFTVKPVRSLQPPPSRLLHYHQFRNPQ